MEKKACFPKLDKWTTAGVFRNAVAVVGSPFWRTWLRSGRASGWMPRASFWGSVASFHVSEICASDRWRVESVTARWMRPGCSRGQCSRGQSRNSSVLKSKKSACSSGNTRFFANERKEKFIPAFDRRPQLRLPNVLLFFRASFFQIQHVACQHKER